VLERLDFLSCPRCGEAFEPGSGLLQCFYGHTFPVVDGLPVFLTHSVEDSTAIQESFSRQWAHFDYSEDRTWGESAAERRSVFLQQVNLTEEDLKGKRVLDAGCGNGVLSNEISTFGCEVVGADVSDAVRAAHIQFAGNPRLQFVQADVRDLPFVPGSFDVVFSAGVLHHTRSTREAFDRVIRMVAPGGTFYVWLYWPVPGRTLAAKLYIRKLIAPLPGPVKHTVVVGLLPQALFRDYVGRRRGSGRPRLAWRERLVVLLDSLTPRYRWTHTPQEVRQWYREHGFEDITTTHTGEWGFGMAAKRPGPAAEAAPRARATATAS
jgi:ubiquinone/menaquinone biosynthesis C-methylase UbiE